jgi:hypothetical protein
MQVGQVADAVGQERAGRAALIFAGEPGLGVPPHEVMGDELPAPVEQVGQAHLPARAGEGVVLGDLGHRQRERGLGLGRLDPDRIARVLIEQAVGDRRAQPLERLVGALLGDERRQLAHLAVVDRVLDAIGERGVTLADIETEVQQQTLSDLTLGRRDTVMGVERQPADLDRHLGFGARLVILVDVVEIFGVIVAHARRLRSSSRLTRMSAA